MTDVESLPVAKRNLLTKLKRRAVVVCGDDHWEVVEFWAEYRECFQAWGVGNKTYSIVVKKGKTGIAILSEGFTIVASQEDALLGVLERTRIRKSFGWEEFEGDLASELLKAIKPPEPLTPAQEAEVIRGVHQVINGEDPEDFAML